MTLSDEAVQIVCPICESPRRSEEEEIRPGYFWARCQMCGWEYCFDEPDRDADQEREEL